MRPASTENEPFTNIPNNILVEHKALSLHENVSESVVRVCACKGSQ